VAAAYIELGGTTIVFYRPLRTQNHAMEPRAIRPTPTAKLQKAAVKSQTPNIPSHQTAPSLQIRQSFIGAYSLIELIHKKVACLT